MTLASKLPLDHPFAGGYPRVGGQPLPTDPDAIDYLERVKAADGGVAVEVGVAMAVDAFVKGCKADGTWDALKASCILCGARTISGALVPLVGTAPTPYNFASGDYSRTTGLVGDGATKYLDTNRANNADGQDDNHNAVFLSATGNTAGARIIGGNSAIYATGDNSLGYSSGDVFVRSRNQSGIAGIAAASEGLLAQSRSISSSVVVRSGGVNYSVSQSSQTPSSTAVTIFSGGADGSSAPTNARLAFYSIGSSLDLAALDNRVSTLVSAIAAAI